MSADYAQDLAEKAAMFLASADDAAKRAGTQTTVEKFTKLAATTALVSIAQSLATLAASQQTIAHQSSIRGDK